VEPRKFMQFIEQAARLPVRQRADLADLLNRSLLQERTAPLIGGAGRVPGACPALPAYHSRFKQWLRFHGVASRYLPD
jgi:hypothetical protein